MSQFFLMQTGMSNFHKYYYENWKITAECLLNNTLKKEAMYGKMVEIGIVLSLMIEFLEHKVSSMALWLRRTIFISLIFLLFEGISLPLISALPQRACQLIKLIRKKGLWGQLILFFFKAIDYLNLDCYHKIPYTSWHKQKIYVLALAGYLSW